MIVLKLPLDKQAVLTQPTKSQTCFFPALCPSQSLTSTWILKSLRIMARLWWERVIQMTKSSTNDAWKFGKRKEQ